LNLLVDTHALLWWLADHPRLSASARSTLSNPESVVFVSVASVWEVAIKQRQGRLNSPDDLLQQIAANRWLHLPITLQHGIAAGSLPPYHADPFDRMLVAQAQVEGLTIMTRDPQIERYDVPTLRA